ncbi:ATP-binding protein [Actinocorallia lasiicapitis]
MSATIGDRLRWARRRGFVGRAAELALVREALAVPEPPFSVLYLHGPGGVGKTALLDAFHELAEEVGACPVRLDGRTLEPTREAVLAALAVAAGRRALVLVDTYERLVELDGWFRDELIPRLPGRTLLVLAGRVPPPPAWTDDLGWRGLVRVRPLANLGPADASALLRVEGVPDALHERVLAVTHGHPLALTLLAEAVRQDPAAGSGLRDSPDVVRRLVERFAADVPGPRHRAALQVCARVRHTTEGLLGQLLGGDDTDELFAWLRGLAFVEQGRYGAYPHDLVREVLEEDLRWREPAVFHELTRAARMYFRRLITGTRDREQHHWIAEAMYLLRSNPKVGGALDWSEAGTAYADDYRPGDRGDVLRMVAAHEGDASAELAARWLEHPAAVVVVLREPPRAEPLGFAMVLDVHRLSPQEAAADPATAAALACVGPRRPGEEVVLSRFFMDRELYQGRSVARTAFMARQAQHLLNRPLLAFALVNVRVDAASAMALLSSFAYARAPRGEFTVGGRGYATFLADCRERSTEEWVGTLADQVSDERHAAVLSREQFGTAVRDALRGLHRSDLLDASPLTAVRPTWAGPGALREALLAAAVGVAADPREEHLHRAVDRTYLRPAGNQERAAQLLGLPFSTYRRHLTRGVTRIADLLWHAE